MYLSVLSLVLVCVCTRAHLQFALRTLLLRVQAFHTRRSSSNVDVDATLLPLPPLLQRLLVLHPMTRLILVSHGETSDTEVFRAAVPPHTFVWG
jgi:hypothetical protein